MRNHKLLYQSSYDRGLEHLLKMWPEIKAKYKDATLDIAYGWDTFDTIVASNPERMAWKQRMVEQMKQEGITEHGRIGKEELKKLQETCGILAYPSHFFEIFCIGVVEAAIHGCVPVTMNIGALPETVGCGVVVDGDIHSGVGRTEYLKALLALMGDENKRKKLSEAGKDWAKRFTWDKIAKKWSDVFEKPTEEIKLSVYTPTIRRGWWNIMAANLAKQTHKNFEWIIVDDYPEDRADIAAEYERKYGLHIRYVNGKKRKIKRTYGLCNANNTALQMATGEVLVFLQDFILMPIDGLEDIATLYRKNPNSLQALPDMYFAPKYEPQTDKEDWFGGKLDVTGQFIRKNIRLQNLGLRFTTNPMDFEQNYGAIPVHIAKDLGGWYEFFDEGLGWDNTDIAWRAMQKGYTIILDENNIAICIDHYKTLAGTKENGLGRERKLNDPRYYWMMTMVKAGKLPLTRTQEIDDEIDLQYTMPDDSGDETIWIQKNARKIAAGWIEERLWK